MKIGVDASCWANKRGYGRYARELLRALLACDQQNLYRFFLDSETAQEVTDLPEQAQTVIVKTSQAATRAAGAAGRRSLRDMWAMSRAVQQGGRDLDLFYFPSVYTYFPLRTRARVIVTIHDTIAEHYPQLIFPNRRSRLFWRLKVGLAVRQAHLVITVSETARREIIKEFGLKEEAVRVVSDAVSGEFRPLGNHPEARQVLARYGIGHDERFILYVGGISPHKNLATLLDAYASLLRGQGVRDVRLVLVGDFQKDVFYSAYQALRERVEQDRLSGRVVFTGFVPDSDLVHLYNAAEMLVLPSFDEGFGLPALEAMACGTPVVASRAGALPEVIGQAGLFFNPYAPEELGEHLQRLLADHRLRAELGRKGLQRAREFTWERSARVALGIFEELSGSRQQGLRPALPHLSKKGLR
jgi:glycosyltransferase involved in cell wall biosynthesis